MINRLLPWVIVLALAAGGYLWWRRVQARANADSIVYRTAPVQRGDVTQNVAATGTLSAITTVDVGSQVSGQIATLHADFNSTVKAGQLVAEIDPATYETKVLQAEADLASAKSTLELKQLNAARADELFKKQLLSRADHDQTVTELHQQQSTVRIKEAALKAAQLDLGRTKIRSPIDGVVISRDIDLGQTVQATFAAPKLFTIAKDLREMQITASVSEADIGGVEPGQSVSFTVDTFPGRAFTGKVREVRNNPTTSSNVVNYATIIDVSNANL
jgi:HlyD family secretion protein